MIHPWRDMLGRLPSNDTSNYGQTSMASHRIGFRLVFAPEFHLNPDGRNQRLYPRLQLQSLHLSTLFAKHLWHHEFHLSEPIPVSSSLPRGALYHMAQVNFEHPILQ